MYYFMLTKLQNLFHQIHQLFLEVQLCVVLEIVTTNQRDFVLERLADTAFQFLWGILNLYQSEKVVLVDKDSLGVMCVCDEPIKCNKTGGPDQEQARVLGTLH